MGKFVAPGVEKINKQHYRVWWPITGTNRRASEYVHGTRDEAIALRTAKIDEQRRGEYVAPSDLTLGEYLDAWATRMKTLGSQATSTKLFYDRQARALKSGLGQVMLQDLTKEHVQDYYVTCLTTELTGRMSKAPKPEPLFISQNTMSKRHRVLMMTLDDAADDGLLVRNPLRIGKSKNKRRSEFPRPPKPHAECWTAAEMRIVLDAVAGTGHELLTLIGFSTGMRLGEILALHWRDIDLPSQGPCTITIAGIVDEITKRPLATKPYGKSSNARRTISGGEALGDALRAHHKGQSARRLKLGVAWEDQGLVLCGDHGQILRPSQVSRGFSKIIRGLETAKDLAVKETTFHTTRHTHATLLLQARERIDVVSKRLGHSSIKITLDYYGHVMPGDDASVATTFDAILKTSEATNETLVEALPERAEAALH
ncbi:MAG: site-specific integrase [Coriobacteriia bacterium]|nr:site-specific integrase [Coriobacteriia bacterium]